MTIVEGKSISVAQARVEGAIVQTLRDWAVAHPAELALFDSQMKKERKELHKAKGMSRDGNLRKFGELPVSLNRLMNHRFGVFWHKDLKLVRLFWSHFQVGKIYRWSDHGRKV